MKTPSDDTSPATAAPPTTSETPARPQVGPSSLLGWMAYGAQETIQSGLRSLSASTGKTFCKPAWASIAVTSRCNSKCLYCDVWKIPNKQLSLEQVIKVLDDLADWLAPTRLQFSGGEPLLRKDLEKMVEHAAKRGFLPSVVNNASLMKPARARALLDAGLYGMDISLDSVTPAIHDHVRGVPGAWKMAVGAVDTMIALGAARRTSVQTVLTNANMGEIEALLDWVTARGLKGLGVQILDENFEGPHRPHWWEEQPLWIRDIPAVERLAQRLLKLQSEGAPVLSDPRQLHLWGRYHVNPENMGTDPQCLVAWLNFAIGPSGEVRLCHKMEPVGNVLETSPKEIWWSVQAAQTRKATQTCPQGCRILHCTFPPSPLVRAKRVLATRKGRNGVPAQVAGASAGA